MNYYEFRTAGNFNRRWRDVSDACPLYRHPKQDIPKL